MRLHPLIKLTKKYMFSLNIYPSRGNFTQTRFARFMTFWKSNWVLSIMSSMPIQWLERNLQNKNTIEAHKSQNLFKAEKVLDVSYCCLNWIYLIGLVFPHCHPKDVKTLLLTLCPQLLRYIFNCILGENTLLHSQLFNSNFQLIVNLFMSRAL